MGRIVVAPSQNMPQLTRRRLLAAGGASGAAAMVALNPALARAANAVAADPAYLRRSSYAGLVGQGFAVDWWGSSDVLTLVAVNDLTDLSGRDDAFSLTFSGAPSVRPGNDAIALSNRSVGKFDLFVAPVDAAGTTQLFEAVVNRSVGANRRRIPQPRPGGGQSANPHKRRSAVRSVSAKRTANGVRLEIVLGDGTHAKHAHGWLAKGQRLVAAFGSSAVHDHRVVVKVPTQGRLRRGSYEVVVAAGGQGAALDQVAIELR
jgi:hypothetical protein